MSRSNLIEGVLCFVTSMRVCVWVDCGVFVCELSCLTVLS